MTIQSSKRRGLIKTASTAAAVIALLLLPGIINVAQQSLQRKNSPQLGVAQAAQPATATNAAGSVPKDGYVRLTFDLLKSWTYNEKNKTPIPETITKFDGQKVEMVGYMMPLTEIQNIKQFLFVPYLWGCCYGEPPAVNHMVVGQMAGGKTTRLYNDLVKLRGVFRCGEVREDGELVSLYHIEVEDIRSP